MPANRSRTVGWRRCLRQIKERKGAIEIALARNYEEAEQGHHLVWRVHLLDVRDDEILIEPPAALGQTIPLQPGVVLTVEPGIFVPGVGGASFSDTVVVTENGHETLTRYPIATEY